MKGQCEVEREGRRLIAQKLYGGQAETLSPYDVVCSEAIGDTPTFSASIKMLTPFF